MNVGKRILIVAVIAGGLTWPVITHIQQLRHEHAVRRLLLTVQQALQDYHVDQERYIPRERLTGSEVINVLLDFGFLDKPPINPWTGTAWVLDGAEPDRLRYETDPNFETYALRALEVATDKILIEIDSVEHLSLE